MLREREGKRDREIEVESFIFRVESTIENETLLPREGWLP